MYVLINNFNDSIVRSIVRLNSRVIVSKSTCCLVFIAISACLLSYSPLVHAQNSSNVTKVNNIFNQAKNASMDLVNQTVTLIKNDTNSSKLLNQLKSDFGSLINEFSNILSR